jgi:hypothetical protein
VHLPWQVDFEFRSKAWLAVHPDIAATLLHDAVNKKLLLAVSYGWQRD